MFSFNISLGAEITRMVTLSIPSSYTKGMQPHINRVFLSTIISFLVLITMAKRRNQSGQMIKQPLTAFSVMPCATEEDMETAMFVGATQDIGYCKAVIFEGTGMQYCNTPLWSYQPNVAVLCSTGRDRAVSGYAG